MNLKELNLFCEDNNFGCKWDNAIDELADVMKENGENIYDLNWLEQDTFYVDFVYDCLESNIDNFDKKFNEFLKDKQIESEIRKQVG